MDKETSIASISTQALSEAWRINKSTIPTIEMAQALRAMSKVIGTVLAGNNLYQGVAQVRPPTVQYATASSASKVGDTNIITIGSDLVLKGPYPLPAETIDVLTGLSIHEVGHHLVDSFSISPMDYNKLVIGPHTIKFLDVIAIGEDAFVDCYMKIVHRVAGKYIVKARQAYKLPPEQIDWENPLEHWKAFTLYGTMPQPANQLTTQIVGILANLSKELIQLASRGNLSSPTRSTLYYQTYQELYQLGMCLEAEKRLRAQSDMEGALDIDIPPDYKPEEAKSGKAEPEMDNQQDDMKDNAQDDTTADTATVDGTNEANEAEEDKEEDDDEEGDKAIPEPLPKATLPVDRKAPMPTELLQDILKSIQQNEMDLTPVLQKLLSEEPAYSTDETPPVIWRNSTSPLATKFNERLAKELIWLQDLRNAEGSEVARQELKGRVDQANLHRVATDQKMFKRVYRMPEKDLDLVLLLDASGSMSSKLSIYEAALALHKVIPESVVVSYAAKGGMVIIEVVAEKRGQARIISPDGDTPSGLALLATASQFPNSLIVHFSDGESNIGSNPELVCGLIAKKYPAVTIFHILMARHNYHKSLKGVALINNITQFPGELRKLAKVWLQMRRKL